MIQKPNIVFILADDLGWCDLAADGSRFHESPNIDRIAKEGMRFTQGYAASQVCSPSRASILTGKYPPRHGITDYIGALSGEAWRKLGRFNKLLPAEYEHGLREDEITFAEVLRRAGYHTFFAGKWHCGEEGAYPENFGFEINKGGWKVGSPAGGYFAPWVNPSLPPGPAGESLPIRLGKETSQFIAEHKDQPFFAYLSFYSVHGPLQTSQARWEKFRQKATMHDAPEKRFIFDRTLPVRQIQDCPIYAGMIEAMDEAVGIVLDQLDELGLAENTLVCFTSDNGGVSSGDSYASSMLPLRGGKGRQWEGGIREPFYVRMPGKIKEGTLCDVPVSGIDFYPTFMDFAGLPVPSEQIIDGQSILPLLMGEKKTELLERDLFWHYPHYGNQGGDPSSTIRNGDWKLIHYYEDDRDELYNLRSDPGETNDVVAFNKEMATTLRQRLDTWLTEAEAKIPSHDPQYDPTSESDYLHNREHELMPALEVQHAQYLDAKWQPDEDWWGSQITID